MALLEPEAKPKAKSNSQPKKIEAKDEDEIIKQMEMRIEEEPEENDETSKLINFDLTIPSKGKGSYPSLQLNEEPPAVIPKLNFQAPIEPEIEEEPEDQTESASIEFYQPYEPNLDAPIPTVGAYPSFFTQSEPVQVDPFPLFQFQVNPPR